MQQTEWSPPTLGIAACGILGLILAIGAVTVITDAPGRILVGIDGVGLVFTRWDLGTDPLNVLDALTAAGYAGSS